MESENKKQSVNVRLDCLLYGLFVYLNAKQEKVTQYEFESMFKGWYGLNITDYLSLDTIRFMLLERELYG